ncbi:hypothetical protein NPIL_253721 [Nephila pilipes]|uniref:Uncharacterized protein n=1 Tax=Nephila pilipes TaxID=299642 RepID=A0A8X6MWS6_NEPPI|nr:hypothetical protein NPIL_253721 [Nephila pilipes]
MPDVGVHALSLKDRLITILFKGDPGSSSSFKKGVSLGQHFQFMYLFDKTDFSTEKGGTDILLTEQLEQPRHCQQGRVTETRASPSFYSLVDTSIPTQGSVRCQIEAVVDLCLHEGPSGMGICI